jgi:ankyrin repeat protein
MRKQSMTVARPLTIFLTALLLFAACSRPPAPVAVRPIDNVQPTPGATNVPALSEPEAALLQACEKSDLKAVKDLLDKGVSINARDRDGRQPIIEATYWQHADVVRLLIERAADVNAKKVDGTTALDFAISLRNKEIEQMLRQAGAGSDQKPAATSAAATSPSPVATTK